MTWSQPTFSSTSHLHMSRASVLARSQTRKMDSSLCPLLIPCLCREDLYLLTPTIYLPNFFSFCPNSLPLICYRLCDHKKLKDILGIIVRAAITNYHKTVGLNNKYIGLHIWRLEACQSSSWQGQFLLRTMRKKSVPSLSS